MKLHTATPILAAPALLVCHGSSLRAAYANEGEALYSEHCASCHAASLRGSAHGAALSGPAFTDKWSQQSALTLRDYQQAEMPPGEAHTLSPAQHSAITEFVIAQSNLPEDSPLASSVNDLLNASGEAPDAVEFSAADSVMDFARNAGAYSMKQITDFRKVDTAELDNPLPRIGSTGAEHPTGMDIAP